ncbi:hypothetical protein PV458_22870 [Streptomyces sp. MN03-5084-2B]|nr:hypothetical protein [Streptomyces sp. MN03-5084-2B]
MTLAEALPGSGGSRPFTEKSDVHNVAGKVFLIVTVKAEPEHGRRLPDEHPSITAGRFSARRATKARRCSMRSSKSCVITAPIPTRPRMASTWSCFDWPEPR